MPPRLVLVGPPGAGKTTVGQAISARLELGFRDTDQDIEATAGKEISAIFFDEGEEHFRELEVAAVKAALESHTGVLSLGGGAVIDAETRERLLAHTVVYLQVGMADAAKRVGLARDRPVLALNPRAMLHTLLAERDPLYREVATMTISTDDKTIDAVVEELVSAMAGR